MNTIRHCYGRRERTAECRQCEFLEYCNDAADLPLLSGPEESVPRSQPERRATESREIAKAIGELFVLLADPEEAFRLAPVLADIGRMAQEHPTTFRVIVERIRNPTATKKAIADAVGVTRTVVIYHLRKACIHCPVLRAVMAGDPTVSAA